MDTKPIIQLIEAAKRLYEFHLDNDTIPPSQFKPLLSAFAAAERALADHADALRLADELTAESKRIDEQAKNRFEQSRREQAAHEAALALANVVLQARGVSGEMTELARKFLDLAEVKQ